MYWTILFVLFVIGAFIGGFWGAIGLPILGAIAIFIYRMEQV